MAARNADSPSVPMQLLIDPREGSKTFLKDFGGECDKIHLDGGDFAFTGKGPDDAVWLIGIEHKKVSDLVQSIQSNRFLGTQLPEMAKLYDVMFLMVEGHYKADPVTGRLVQSYRGGNGFSFGISYKAFDNFLTAVEMYSSMMGKPCIVKRTGSHKESAQTIRNLYDYFQKDWDEHKSFGRPDLSKVQKISEDLSLLRVEPGDDAYPERILRQSLLQIKGFSWRIAGHVAGHFGTMEKALAASGKDWQVEGVGKVLAARAYQALHGRAEEKQPRKRKVRKKGG